MARKTVTSHHIFTKKTPIIDQWCKSIYFWQTRQSTSITTAAQKHITPQKPL